MRPKRTLLPEVLDLGKQSEGLRLWAYPDPASPLAKATPQLRKRGWGFRPARTLLMQLPDKIAKLSGAPWTVGYGHTKGVTLDTHCEEGHALEFLDDDLDESQNAVEELVKVELNDYQYGALVWLVFNIGRTRFASSTLLRKLNAGDYSGAAARFDDWVKTARPDGSLEFNQGLWNRRQREKALFLREDHTSRRTEKIVESVPDEHKPISRDPNMTVPTVTGIAALGGAASEAAQKFEGLAAYSETVKTIFIILSMVGICITIWMNYRKRKEAR